MSVWDTIGINRIAISFFFWHNNRYRSRPACTTSGLSFQWLIHFPWRACCLAIATSWLNKIKELYSGLIEDLQKPFTIVGSFTKFTSNIMTFHYSNNDINSNAQHYIGHNRIRNLCLNCSEHNPKSNASELALHSADIRIMGFDWSALDRS